jgi:hypothetical protein
VTVSASKIKVGDKQNIKSLFYMDDKFECYFIDTPGLADSMEREELLNTFKSENYNNEKDRDAFLNLGDVCINQINMASIFDALHSVD